jgi:hypothetical protein
LQAPTVQMPPVHAANAFGTLQTWPHVPQLFESPAVEVSHPVAGFMSQSVKPGSHVPTAHRPFTHIAVPLAMLHFTLQPPQLFGSFWVSVSQPSETVLLQSLEPKLHIPIAHVPLLQAGTAFGVMHALPQEPQLLGVVFVFVSQPSP